MSNYKIILQAARFNGFSETLAKYVTAQSAHETNGWTSPIYNSNNNAFGMKYAGQATSTGANAGYANYININQSVTDFARWWARRGFSLVNLGVSPMTLAQYVKFLKTNSYFEDTEASYLRGCQYWYDKFFKK